jgi:hypothetical protein
MRKLAVGLLPLLVGLGSGPAGAAAPSIITFAGVCDASAGVVFDDSQVIIGDDEQPVLAVYTLDGGKPRDTIKLSQSFGPSAAKEADTEAATLFHDRIVWISSNGRNKDGEAKRKRFRLFASHRLENGRWSEAFSRSFGGLPDALLATTDASYEPLRKSIGDLNRDDEDLAPKNHGFNIEGLTTTRDGRALLVGLRNPQLDGKALLFPIENADDLLDGKTDHPALGPITTVDLGGRGVRDIAWSPAHDVYLIAAGQTNDDVPGPGFALFAWDGKGQPSEIGAFRPVLDANPDFHPEVVVPLPERSGDGSRPLRRVLIVSDDGTRLLPSGAECKDGSEAEKSFRGVILDIP